LSESVSIVTNSTFLTVIALRVEETFKTFSSLCVTVTYIVRVDVKTTFTLIAGSIDLFWHTEVVFVTCCAIRS